MQTVKEIEIKIKIWQKHLDKILNDFIVMETKKQDMSVLYVKALISNEIIWAKKMIEIMETRIVYLKQTEEQPNETAN